jgi:TonB-linked SusC/RagA family outer membrane protein
MKIKRIILSLYEDKRVEKHFLIMRITCFLILVLTLQTNASLWSQTTNMNVNLKNSTLRELFMQIEENSNYRFFYNNEDVNINQKISVEAENKSIATILTLAFDGLSYSFKEMENKVILVEKINSLKEVGSQQQRKTIKGTVRNAVNEPLPGVTIHEKGTNHGAITDSEGNYSISVAENAILMFSFVGMKTQELAVAGKSQFNVVMDEEIIGVDEVVVVGYGIQKKSDITGAVASLGQERLEMTPNLNIAQAIQGAVPGIMVQTSSAGAVSSQEIMIRGRNSINASNAPLIVVDGVPYSGSLKDLNPNDVKSVDILKDASAAAIYGSRGANGVILITTKMGIEGKPQISYEGYYSMQRFVKLPDLMNGEEFYNFKKERTPTIMTQSEQEIYDSGQWTDWLDLATRNGNSTEHNLSVSGGFNHTNYYISGGVLNVKGLAVNDDYLRLTSRINIDTEIAGWLTIGTRTQLSYDDRGGISPTFDGDNGVFLLNPLTKAYDENGNLTIYPWEEDIHFANALEGTLAVNTDETNQVISNNYAIVKFPFIPGLQYRINTGFKIRYRDTNTYYGTNTKTGYEDKGNASTGRYRDNMTVIENIVDYNREFGKHKLFLTGVYSFESEKNMTATVSMRGFPHDFLTWYSAAQATVKEPRYSYTETALISQMLRLNYSYDSRYLLTLTGRRDGYSGFGDKTKWGIFPSVALGWNLARENFFPWKNMFNELKLRFSYGLNGNQAIGAYQTITRLARSLSDF